MAEEFKKYIDVFLSIDPSPAAQSSNGNVATRTWRHNGDTYLLAVNCTTNAQTAVITLSEAPGKVVGVDFGASPEVKSHRVRFSLGLIDYAMVRMK